MTNVQKRESVRAVLSRYPALSSRVVAGLAGVSSGLVRVVRDCMESSGEIARWDRVMGIDGRMRRAWMGGRSVLAREQGGVYFISRGHNGPVKIGWTSHLMRRWGQLQAAEREETFLMGWIRGGTRADERAMHKRFSHLRIQGEWFRQDSELLSFMRGLERL